MIYESYVCDLASGLCEYGFTFRDSPGTDDTVFDLVLGAIVAETEADTLKMEADWKTFTWAAKAICDAANDYKKPLCKCYTEDGNDAITGECNDCGRIIKAEAS